MSPETLYVDLPLPAPHRAVISTRAGGVSPPPWDSQNHGTATGDLAGRVSRNGERLLGALGLPAAADGEPWARVSQVHGRECVRVDGQGIRGEADALWTSTPGVVLSVRVADCAAVALAHPRSGRVGLAHAGWRGAAAGVVASLLHAMQAPAAELHATISPHLGPCCFEVGPEVAAAFAGRHCAPRHGDRSSLDLGAALRSELLALGVPGDRIHADGRCTACERHLFFSHRRDRGATGRMVALAWLAASSHPSPDARTPLRG